MDSNGTDDSRGRLITVTSPQTPSSERTPSPHPSRSSTSRRRHVTPTPVAPDGGYGWVVTAASFLIMVIVDGVCFSFGIFYLAFLDYFGESKAKTSWVGSVLNGTYLAVGPIVSALTNVFGCRKVAISGGILAAIAFFISTYSRSIDVLIVTYGLLGGMGFGLMYLPGIVIVGFYFDRRRALATGIAVCGSGIGAFVFAPLCEHLLEMYGWQGATWIIAGISLNAMVLGGLFRPLEDNEPKTKQSGSLKSDDSCSTVGRDTTLSCAKQEQEDGTASKQSKSNPTQHEAAPRIECQPLLKEILQKKVDSKMTCSLTDIRKQCKKRNISECPKSQSMENVCQPRRSHSETKHGVVVIEEFFRPLGRKDIFYPGSARNIPEVRDQIKDQPDKLKDVLTFKDPVVSDVETCPGRQKKTGIIVSLKKMFDLTLLADPVFLVYGISCFLCMTGFFVPFIFLPDHAVEMGSGRQAAAFLLSIIGIANTVSRVACGFISDLPGVDCLMFNNWALIIAGVATIMCPHCPNYGMLAGYAVVFGSGIAVFVSLRSIIAVELMGLDRLTSAFGLVTMCQGMSAFIGAPIAGALYDRTGDYTFSFYLAGVCLAMAGVICLPLRKLARWRANREEVH